MASSDSAVEGIDPGPVTAWFEANIDGVEPPLTFDLIAGGRSNLTYKVTDAAGKPYVLRRHLGSSATEPDSGTAGRSEAKAAN